VARLRPKGQWSGRRVAVTALTWVLLVVGVSVVRVFAALDAYPREPGTEDVYYIVNDLPGWLVLALGPPLALVAVWIWLRRSPPPPGE